MASLLFKCLLLLVGCVSLNSCKDKDAEPDLAQVNPPPNADATRVICYNMHYGIGIDGALNLHRIANVIKDSGAEIVVLNEVDRIYDPRSKYQDQLQILADLLGMDFQFQKTTWKSPIPASGNKPREFGHAILSKKPIKFLNARIMKHWANHYHGLLETEIEINSKPVIFYITHLDTDAEARAYQVREVREWMAERTGPKVLLGDMNGVPTDPSIYFLKEGLVDAFEDQPNAFTFKANNPTIRIDYILGTPDIKFSNSRVIKTQASDHFPIVTDISVAP